MKQKTLKLTDASWAQFQEAVLWQHPVPEDYDGSDEDWVWLIFTKETLERVKKVLVNKDRITAPKRSYDEQFVTVL
jgi:hypothetical protein